MGLHLALIVAQEKLVDTGRAIIWRMTGTVAGLVIAVASGTVLQLLHAPTWLQIGVAVAIAACLARIKNELRVAMWTAPIVFIMQRPARVPCDGGSLAGFEVILGGLWGPRCISSSNGCSALASAAKPRVIRDIPAPSCQTTIL